MQNKWMDFDAALKIAVTAHQGQVDKCGDHYILHPIRVALNFSSEAPMHRIAAILHDVVEDTSVTLSNLEALGCPRRVLEALDALTHRNGEPYANYIERVKKNQLAIDVKYFDLIDNLSPARVYALPEEARNKVLSKYKPVLHELAPLFVGS